MLPSSAQCGLVALSFWLLGCAGDPHGVGRTVSVAGKVTLNGQPLTTGMVVYRPDAARGNTSKHEPRGNLDGQGAYKLSTADREGAPPGWYKVAVVASKPREAAAPEGGHSHGAGKNAHAPPQWIVPLKYLDPEKSGLSAEAVESPSPTAYDLHLKTGDDRRPEKVPK